MHHLYYQADEATRDVIGAAIEVHKDKGPGLLESIYEWCLTKELELRGRLVQNQENVIVRYKQFQREDSLKFDLLVDKCLLVEVKAVETVHAVNKAQLLSYMKLLDVPLGLVINFHEMKLIDGVSRLILPGANVESFNRAGRDDKESPLCSLRFLLFKLIPRGNSRGGCLWGTIFWNA